MRCRRALPSFARIRLHVGGGGSTACLAASSGDSGLSTTVTAAVAVGTAVIGALLAFAAVWGYKQYRIKVSKLSLERQLSSETDCRCPHSSFGLAPDSSLSAYRRAKPPADSVHGRAPPPISLARRWTRPCRICSWSLDVHSRGRHRRWRSRQSAKWIDRGWLEQPEGDDGRVREPLQPSASDVWILVRWLVVRSQGPGPAQDGRGIGKRARDGPATCVGSWRPHPEGQRDESQRLCCASREWPRKLSACLVG